MFSCSIPSQGYGCLKIMGSNCLPAQMNKSYLCLSRRWSRSFVGMQGLQMIHLRGKMQLGSLIKKTNEASCLLTQFLAQGIWSKPYPITLLGKFYSTSQSAGEEPHYPPVVCFSVSFILSLSYPPPCTIMLASLSFTSSPR